MDHVESNLKHWTPEQIAQGREWARAWRVAGEFMERLRRDELPRIDGYRAIELLSGPADYTVEPRVARPASGLVEQQYWFMKAATSA